MLQEAGCDPITGAAPRLYERAFQILAEEIRQKTLGPGSHLNETGIAARFGISRPPARQALLQLQEAGLVEKAAGRGFVVCGDPDDKAVSQAPPELQRLVSASSWERIYNQVEAEIISRIAIGSWRIVETELARTYHVSRTVARDVLARLQQAGLVRKDDRSRWFAPALTPHHVGELYEMRWVLEPAALKNAAPNVPPSLLARMRCNLEEALANAANLGSADLDRFENEMHVELLSHGSNATMIQTIHTHQSLIIAHRFLYRHTNEMFEVEPFLPEHLEIVEHLQAGDPGKAADALADHLKISLDRSLSRIDMIATYCQPEPLAFLEKLDI
ncbi:GntR family transcriptional regulator [uncultured Roseibium sp.]|uniref:GntR family transcriptional regulator n=1 Tax=uncultured Roseibium sp. TaxID=1936171 RepID=UPI002638195C|nr:GntR family transcriptional regulator [uncultured Roseibium sp.]